MTKKENIYNLPNFITLARIFFIIPVVYLLLRDLSIPAGIIFFAFLAFDMLDGFLARSLNMITKFGAKFDYIADIIFGGTIIAVQILTDKVPLYIWIPTLLSYAVIAIGIIPQLREKKKPQVSKVKERGAFVAFGLVFMFLLNTYNTITITITYFFIAGMFYFGISYLLQKRRSR